MTFEYVRSLHSYSLVDWGVVQVAGAVMLKAYGPLARIDEYVLTVF